MDVKHIMGRQHQLNISKDDSEQPSLPESQPVSENCDNLSLASAKSVENATDGDDTPEPKEPLRS